MSINKCNNSNYSVHLMNIIPDLLPSPSPYPSMLPLLAPLQPLPPPPLLPLLLPLLPLLLLPPRHMAKGGGEEVAHRPPSVPVPKCCQRPPTTQGHCPNLLIVVSPQKSGWATCLLWMVGISGGEGLPWFLYFANDFCFSVVVSSSGVILKACLWFR